MNYPEFRTAIRNAILSTPNPLLENYRNLSHEEDIIQKKILNDLINDLTATILLEAKKSAKQFQISSKKKVSDPFIKSQAPIEQFFATKASQHIPSSREIAEIFSSSTPVQKTAPKSLPYNDFTHLDTQALIKCMDHFDLTYHSDEQAAEALLLHLKTSPNDSRIETIPIPYLCKVRAKKNKEKREFYESQLLDFTKRSIFWNSILTFKHVNLPKFNMILRENNIKIPKEFVKEWLRVNGAVLMTSESKKSDNDESAGNNDD